MVIAAAQDTQVVRHDYFRRVGRRGMAPLWESLHRLVSLEPDSPARVCSCRYEQVRPLLSVAVLFNYSDRAAKEALGLWCERLS